MLLLKYLALAGLVFQGKACVVPLEPDFGSNLQDQWRVPGWVGWNTAGVGVATGLVNSGGDPDLIVVHVDRAKRGSEIHLRVGFDLKSSGNDFNPKPSRWGEIFMLRKFSAEAVVLGFGTAAGDFDNNGRLDLFLSYAIDVGAAGNINTKSWYIEIAWNLDTTGEPTKFTRKLISSWDYESNLSQNDVSAAVYKSTSSDNWYYVVGRSRGSSKTATDVIHRSGLVAQNEIYTLDDSVLDVLEWDKDVVGLGSEVFQGHMHGVPNFIRHLILFHVEKVGGKSSAWFNFGCASNMGAIGLGNGQTDATKWSTKVRAPGRYGDIVEGADITSALVGDQSFIVVAHVEKLEYENKIHIQFVPTLLLFPNLGKLAPGQTGCSTKPFRSCVVGECRLDRCCFSECETCDINGQCASCKEENDYVLNGTCVPRLPIGENCDGNEQCTFVEVCGVDGCELKAECTDTGKQCCIPTTNCGTCSSDTHVCTSCANDVDFYLKDEQFCHRRASYGISCRGGVQCVLDAECTALRVCCPKGSKCNTCNEEGRCTSCDEEVDYLVGSNCIPRLQYGEACFYSGQCKQDSDCVGPELDALCCPKGSNCYTCNNEGICTSCADSYVNQDGKCIKLVGLGDLCTSDVSCGVGNTCFKEVCCDKDVSDIDGSRWNGYERLANTCDFCVPLASVTAQLQQKPGDCILHEPTDTRVCDNKSFHCPDGYQCLGLEWSLPWHPQSVATAKTPQGVCCDVATEYMDRDKTGCTKLHDPLCWSCATRLPENSPCECAKQDSGERYCLTQMCARAIRSVSQSDPESRKFGYCHAEAGICCDPLSPSYECSFAYSKDDSIARQQWATSCPLHTIDGVNKLGGSCAPFVPSGSKDKDKLFAQLFVGEVVTVTGMDFTESKLNSLYSNDRAALDRVVSLAVTTGTKTNAAVSLTVEAVATKMKNAIHIELRDTNVYGMAIPEILAKRRKLRYLGLRNTDVCNKQRNPSQLCVFQDLSKLVNLVFLDLGDNPQLAKLKRGRRLQGGSNELSATLRALAKLPALRVLLLDKTGIGRDDLPVELLEKPEIRIVVDAITLSPSVSPTTSSPTELPTTAVPTDLPTTAAPTDLPTTPDSLATVVPTDSPTLPSQTDKGTDQSDNVEDEGGKDGEVDGPKSEPSQEKGLGTGGLIGIVIGVLVLLALLCLIYWRSNRGVNQTNPQNQSENNAIETGSRDCEKRKQVEPSEEPQAPVVNEGDVALQ